MLRNPQCLSPRHSPPLPAPPPQGLILGRCRFTWGRCLAWCLGRGGGHAARPVPFPGTTKLQGPRLRTERYEGRDATPIGTCWQKCPSHLIRWGDWESTGPPSGLPGGTSSQVGIPGSTGWGFSHTWNPIWAWGAGLGHPPPSPRPPPYTHRGTGD